MCECQVIRLKKGVDIEGPISIIHKKLGNKSQHATADEIINLIIELKETKYKEANYNHFEELLVEYKDIQISYPTIYIILTEANIKSPKKTLHAKNSS